MKRFFTVIIFIALISGSAVYGQEVPTNVIVMDGRILTTITFSELPTYIRTPINLLGKYSDLLELSQGERSRQITNCKFDNNNSNISTMMASRAMDGFFYGLEPAIGTYRINLKSSPNVWYVVYGTSTKKEPITDLSKLAINEPTNCYLTVEMEIRDIKGEIVKAVSKSAVYVLTRAICDNDNTISEISRIIDSLIRQAKEDINSDSHAINDRLKRVYETLILRECFDELSANLWNGASIAILPMSGDMGEDNNMILGEITQYFVNSPKNYFVVSRDYINQVITELSFQGSRYIDQGRAVQIGKWVGARIITVGRMENNGHELFLQAIDVETLQTLGTTFVTMY